MYQQQNATQQPQQPGNMAGLGMGGAMPPVATNTTQPQQQLQPPYTRAGVAPAAGGGAPHALQTSLSTPIGPTLTSPSKDSQAKSPNVASLCKCGQDMIHDIHNKTLDFLSTMRKNSGYLSAQQMAERKAKIVEFTNAQKQSFTILNRVYMKIKEISELASSKQVREEVLYTDDNDEIKGHAIKDTEQATLATEEHKILAEQIRQKNQQLKEIIDKERMLIWEINTMMMMRRTSELYSS